MEDELIQIVDAALAEAARKSGTWISCRPGCFDCCLGSFEITQLDARRLREGFDDLLQRDPARAGAVKNRATQTHESEDDPCPALDPATGTCDLYAARPLLCRVFGPAVREGDTVGACELCYQGATDEEIAACAVVVDPGRVEAGLNEHWERESGFHGPTTVAACLAALP